MAKLIAVMKTLALTLPNSRLAMRPPSAAISAKTDAQRGHQPGPGGEPLSRCCRRDRQAEHQQGADDLRGLGHGERQHEQEQQTDQAGTDAAGLGHLGVDAGEQQRPVEHGHRDQHGDGDAEQQPELAGADAEDLTEQDVRRLGGEPVVEAEQVDAEAEAEGQDHPDGGVPLAFADAEEADRGGDDETADQRTGDRVVGDDEAGRGSGEGQLCGAVHGEGHAAGDDERPDQSADDRDQRAGDQRVLSERPLR